MIHTAYPSIGYNPTMPLFQSEMDATGYGAYFADTFAWCPLKKRWFHVLTKGFPTYRSSAEMFTDPTTGRTYLFGGCKSSSLEK